MRSKLLLLAFAFILIVRSGFAHLWSGILDSDRTTDWTQAGSTITEPASQCSNQPNSHPPSGDDGALNVSSLIAQSTTIPTTENHAAAHMKICAYTVNTVYSVSMQCTVASGNHTGYVYDSSGNLLGSATTTNVGGYSFGFFKLLSTGSETQTSGYTWTTGQICMDYTTGTRCLHQ